MNSPSTHVTPGRYQYTYPSFVDTPQYITVHFLTPDGKQAFVSYPKHPNRKAAQLIPVSWFASVVLVRLDDRDILMTLIETFLTGWSIDKRAVKPFTALTLQPVARSAKRLVA